MFLKSIRHWSVHSIKEILAILRTLEPTDLMDGRTRKRLRGDIIAFIDQKASKEIIMRNNRMAPQQSSNHNGTILETGQKTRGRMISIGFVGVIEDDENPAPTGCYLWQRQTI